MNADLFILSFRLLLTFLFLTQFQLKFLAAIRAGTGPFLDICNQNNGSPPEKRKAFVKSEMVNMLKIRFLPNESITRS